MPLLRMLLLLMLAACGRHQSETDLMAQARQYAARGEAKAAVIQLKNVLQQTPAHGQARLMLGQLYLDIGEVQSAEKELRRALELKVNPGDVLPLLGKALLLQGQYQRLLDELPADEQQPQLLALRGHALLGLNHVDEGRAVFAQISLRHPGSVPALLGQARIALLAGGMDEALTLIAQALTLQADNIDALRLQGDVLRLLGKNTEALAAYQAILKLRPAQVQAHVDLANLYIQFGQLDQARKELSIARQSAPASLLLIYTQALLEFKENKMTAAQDHLALVLRAAPEHLPSNLLMGAVLRSKGAYTQAEQHLRKFLEANPGHAYASKLLASTLLNTGDAKQALALVEPLLPSQQQDVEMMSLAGELYLRLRQYNKSADYFERASKLAPQASMVRAALAMSHLGMGDNDRAVADLEQAAGLDAKSSRVGTLLVLSHLRNRQYDKALAAAQRMEVQHPDNPMVQNLKGGVLLVKRDLSGARAAFEQALKLDPLFFPALDNLTTMDIKDKKHERARLRLEAALAKDKNNSDIMTTLANLAISQGRLTVARGWFERAAQAQPEVLEPSMRLANFYARNQETAKALMLGQKLLASNPSNTQLMALVASLQGSSGQADGALDNWNKLAKLQPESPDIQLRLAAARTAVNDAEGAAQALGKALALYQRAYETRPSPQTVQAWYGALIQAGKTADARSRMQKWLADHGNDQVSRLYYASSLLTLKDYAASTAQFEEVLRQAPGQFVALNNLAWLYQQQRDPRALSYAEQAYKAAPDNPAVCDTLGWLLAEQGKFERALPLLKHAATLAPASTEVRYHYGAALAKSGDRAGARVQLEPLLALKEYERRDVVKALLAQ
ncbi:XrtA/PEP-CTERM system TPR-repeat protein PrsT [Duganella radicis]|uniref:PEP-CTERM system TPR-repeat protein PrsT n=1 Tax=Duganella radicis TaxID=551988 RepID=A0A6L6PBE4_9BURK|nr:XrtA/PEP-CTERM system TPR-repeat protein PrsT [Duganella radicis]MTV36398.1 PEP-CTERM system TPR-repeat protein PrsT [Duganella radicis]